MKAAPLMAVAPPTNDTVRSTTQHEHQARREGDQKTSIRMCRAHSLNQSRKKRVNRIVREGIFIVDGLLLP